VAARRRSSYGHLKPGSPDAGHGDEAMSRYERCIFFDRLCELRAFYDARGDDDSVGSFHVDDVIAHAEQTLDAIEEAIHIDEAPMGTVVGEEPSR
jgi:hypothetical protein